MPYILTNYESRLMSRTGLREPHIEWLKGKAADIVDMLREDSAPGPVLGVLALLLAIEYTEATSNVTHRHIGALAADNYEDLRGIAGRMRDDLEREVSQGLRVDGPAEGVH
jgi:hypothetical protein